MKLRIDFITNSSSSSFVLAFRKDVTINEIKEVILSTNEKEVTETIKDWKTWSDGEERSVNLILQSLAKRLLNLKGYGIELDNWDVVAGEFSSEDDLEDYLVYNCLSNIDSVKFKIKAI